MCRSVANAHIFRNGTQAVPYKNEKKQWDGKPVPYRTETNRAMPKGVTISDHPGAHCQPALPADKLEFNVAGHAKREAR